MTNAAAVLRDHINEIMEIWQKEVTYQVPASREANAIALYDHLPNIINDIADIMDRHIGLTLLNVDKRYLEILENSEHHGRHRATTEHYTVDQIVHEYIIFHRTLTEFLKTHNVYNEEISDLMKYVIETSILKSVGSFSRSIQEMQEKLIGTLAHDIRNPLSAAQMSLAMFEKEDDEEWSEKLLKAAQRSVRKALGLIEGLMDGITVRAGQGIMLNFEESDILMDIQWIYKEAQEVYVSKFILEYEEKPIRGVFDNTAVRRLFENLISNAVKYGSPLHPITISVMDNEDDVDIKIHNYGNPISPEKQKYIFNFLERSDNEITMRNSWGMGLTLANIVAEAHGGYIKLISNEKDGTTFIVKLLKHFNRPGKQRTKLTFKKEAISPDDKKFKA